MSLQGEPHTDNEAKISNKKQTIKHKAEKISQKNKTKTNKELNLREE